MIYRTLTAMTIKGKRLRRGRVFVGRTLSADSIAGLLRAGRIAAAGIPPLEAMPGWEERAAVIAEQYNISDTGAFIELVNLPPPFAEWQGEALKALDAPKIGCQFCRR